MTAVLRTEGVGKLYGGVPALSDVDFAVHAGAVNVLIGENGAGKSTLMRILAGVERPSAGRLLLDGEPVAFASVRDAAARGIGIVHQELNLCPNLSVAENIFLTGCSWLPDKVAEEAAARALLARLGQHIDPAALVGSLRIGEQQIVEIARALAEECRVLILDEPTSALSATEVEALFGVVDELRRGGVAIVYISHKLEELLRIGDHVTVLRDGRLVDTSVASEVSIPWIVERMLGEAGRIARTRPPIQPGETVLAAHDLCLDRTGGAAPLDGVSVEFRAGELTAIYGLLGVGRTELFEILCGARRPDSGTVTLKGASLDGLDVADRVARGLLLVPEDRQREALFANLSVGGNIGLADLIRFLRFGVIAPTRERGAVAGMMARLGVKAASPALPIGALSGGNQQKVVIGRALMPGPSAILLDEPSRGVDVGARASVFETMQDLAAQGLAVAFTTSDVMEALVVADRILVMAGGRITADLRAGEADEARLIGAANAAGEMVH